jgi:hypothetical protein
MLVLKNNCLADAWKKIDFGLYVVKASKIRRLIGITNLKFSDNFNKEIASAKLTLDFYAHCAALQFCQCCRNVAKNFEGRARS